jgi:hypothetical protein
VISSRSQRPRCPKKASLRRTSRAKAQRAAGGTGYGVRRLGEEGRLGLFKNKAVHEGAVGRFVYALLDLPHPTHTPTPPLAPPPASPLGAPPLSPPRTPVPPLPPPLRPAGRGNAVRNGHTCVAQSWPETIASGQLKNHKVFVGEEGACLAPAQAATRAASNHFL